MKVFAILLLTILLSCNTKQGTENTNEKTETTMTDNSSIDKQKEELQKTEIIETFIDSVNIGEKGRCKIEIIKHRVYEDIYVIVKFYNKDGDGVYGSETWRIQNNYSYETSAIPSLEPDISDYNNDNFKDITFVSSTAARGANEIRRLFVYDNQEKRLISIVNSESYPNLRYNKELDCIDAFLVYGGCSTVFLNIKGDSLKEFAEVEIFDGLTVSTIDRNGKRKIIMTDKTNQASYIRYKNFNPLKECDNYY